MREGEAGKNTNKQTFQLLLTYFISASAFTITFHNHYRKFYNRVKLSGTWGDATSFFSSRVRIWLSFGHRSANSKWNKTRQLWPQQSLFELHFDWKITFWIRVLWENPKVRILNRNLDCKGVRATKWVSIPKQSFRCAHFRALESHLLFLSKDRFSFPVVIRFLSACRS